MRPRANSKFGLFKPSGFWQFSCALLGINNAPYDKHNKQRANFKPKGSYLGQANGRTLPAGAHSLV
jgi:hypothetical protein